MSTKFRLYKSLNLTKITQEVLSFWNKNQIFKKSITSRDSNMPFVFFEGPPSANGLPGIHHVMSRTIKDIFCRYKTLKGFQVNRKAGWDTHGLPVELGVEKELGITKEDIGNKISIEEYNKSCRKAVTRYTDIWNDLTMEMGYWVDISDPYMTYTPKYIETVWWLINQLYEKKLLYKGHTIQPYSPKAGTGLSSHELNQPGCYKEVTDTTIVAQFLATKKSLPIDIQKIEGETYFLAWTTTPWTLPSNTALTVGKNINYVVVNTFNPYTFKPINVILAKNLVKKQFDNKFKAVDYKSDLNSYKEGQKIIPYFIALECKGEFLLESRYEQLLPYAKPYINQNKAFRVIPGDFVTTDEGTGIVHTAPTFGQDDAIVAKKAGVPPMLVLNKNNHPVPLVDLQGKFIDNMGPYSGKYVKDQYYIEGQTPKHSIDVEIAIELKEKNRAFRVEKYKHSYPHCWRTDKPILYYPLDSWFIKVTDKKNRMFDLNETINWKPKSTGEKRFGNWLKNVNDWNLSRSRYWGIPLPIWRTKNGSQTIVIDSIKTLKKEIDKSIEAGFMEKNPFSKYKEDDMSDENYSNIDLHKSIVDSITLVSSSGKAMKRELDLIDVWFDSGAMPYAQWHYPFENKNIIEEKKAFPADFIAEGVDQTRGWFYTLHAIGTLVFDSVAYKNVISNGLVLDKNGQKMSKRLKNSIDAFETLKKYGPDATRWYMIYNANPWDNLKFDFEGIKEVQRKFFGTLYNTYSFFALYANLDKFVYREENIPLDSRPEIDRWILSVLHSLIKSVEKAYDSYESTRVAREIQEFTLYNLSNWFVRLSRRRFWKGQYERDKISAYQTLYTCLETVAKLASPIAPFYTDQLYKDLTNVVHKKDNQESVHLSEFPVFNPKLINKKLERRMNKAQRISSLALSLRKKEKIRVRQPLQCIMIPVLDNSNRNDIIAISDLIKSEVNVKQVKLIDNTKDVLIKNIKPNFKVLGPKFGKDMRFVVQIVNQFNQEDIINIEKNGGIVVTINSNSVYLSIDDFEITSQDIEGWIVANDNDLTVALDVTITEKLRKEGVARELVSRIQSLRKEFGLEVTDRIRLSFEKNKKLEIDIKSNKDYIKNETLTDELVFVETVTNGIEVTFDQVNTRLVMEKL